MKASKVWAAFASFLCFLASTAFAASSEAKVTWVSIYGDGAILVFGFQFTNSSCLNNGAFKIPANHPDRKSLLALILAAQASGARLQVTATGSNCEWPEITGNSNTLVSSAAPTG